GQPVCAPGWVRIMPAGPSVPRITTIADGINLLSGARIVSGNVKVTMTEVKDAGTFHATIDGREALDVDAFCTDPVGMRYEFNFKIPPGTAKGTHEIHVRLGRRSFTPLTIEGASFAACLAGLGHRRAFPCRGHAAHAAHRQQADDAISRRCHGGPLGDSGGGQYRGPRRGGAHDPARWRGLPGPRDLRRPWRRS